MDLLGKFNLATWGRGRARPGSIGLALGPRSVHAAQVESARGGLRLSAGRSRALPDTREALLAAPGAFGKWLGEAVFADRPFRGRRIVTSLDPPTAKLMVLSYQLERGASEDERILSLAEERAGAGREDLVVDYQPIRMFDDESTERSALVAVAPRALVINHLERLREAGLEVAALEIAPVALRRLLLHHAWHGSDTNAVLLYAGPEHSELSVLWGRRLVLYRGVDFGEARALEDLTKALGVDADKARAMLCRYGVEPPGPEDPAEDDVAAAHEVSETLREILKPAFYALAEQIEKAIVYTASRSRGAAPDRVYLLGDVARWPRSERLLESLLSIPVHALRPETAFATTPGAATADDLASNGGIALAAGLALRGVADG